MINAVTVSIRRQEIRRPPAPVCRPCKNSEVPGSIVYLGLVKYPGETDCPVLQLLVPERSH